ncbi:MAG: farnesyl diphosphate synthase [Deltaproteobacteria bacterium]
MTPGALHSYLGERRQEVETALGVILAPRRGRPAILTRAMRYAVLGPGKRVRPVLALAAAEAVGGARRRRRAMAAGCAVEMIHAYSLAHDDLPAMDDDALRRGKPSLHRKFDEATAILAGDALLTEAFEVLSATVARDADGARRQVQIISEIALGAGSIGMVAGQLADMASEGRRGVGRKTVDGIHRRKTGALIRAAVRAGAIAGGADRAALARLTVYGESLGLAFQIVDDLLDETADMQVLGKQGGGDRARGKATYPGLLGLDGARRAALAEEAKALDAIAPMGRRGAPLRALLRSVVARAA